MQVYWYIAEGHVANNGYTVNRVSAESITEARKKIEKVHRDFRIFLVDELLENLKELGSGAAVGGKQN